MLRDIKYLLFNTCVSDRYQLYVKKSWITGMYHVTRKCEIVLIGAKRTFYKDVVVLANKKLLEDYLYGIWGLELK